MKKIFVLFISVFLCSGFLGASSLWLNPGTNSNTEEPRSVVFRTTQKLKGSDGYYIYFYTNRKCKVYHGDVFEYETTYHVADGEVFLGNGLKGTYVMGRDGNLNSVYINGVRYFRC